MSQSSPVEPPPPAGRAVWRRRSRGSAWLSFTPQTWVAASSAAIFVFLSLLLAVVPVPFAVRSPGGVTDLLGETDVGNERLPLVEVDGADTFPGSGQVQLLTVATTRVDALVTLPEALVAHWQPKRDVIPKSLQYPPGRTDEQVQAEDRALMADSQQAATVAALRAAGLPVQSLPQVRSVSTAGPAYEKLKPGDYITKVDGKPVSRPDDVYAVVAAKKVNEVIAFSVLRSDQTVSADVTVVASNDEQRSPSIGARFDLGYRHAVRATYHVDPSIGGPSGGLVLALALYERLSKGDLVAGRRVAGTGRIDERGSVGPIGGIVEKLGAAEQARADVMLIPESNCAGLSGIRSNVRVVPVATLTDAVQALNKLQDPTKIDEVPRCQ